MKVLRFSLLTALLSTTAAFADPIPADVAGNYQGLLYTETSVNALVSVTLNSKGTLSGKLTTEEKKVYSFKTKTALNYTATVDPDEEEPIGSATSETIEIKRAKGLDSLFLTLTFNDFDGSDTMEASLSVGETLQAIGSNGFKVKTYAKGETVPTLGSYTVSFELGTNVEDAPAGSGYALAKIDAKGIMKLVGTTGDGTKFTAALPNSPDNEFAFFVNPYKRDGCFFAGRLAMTEVEGGTYHIEVPDSILIGYYDVQWKKTGTSKDKSYRDGFGPLNLLVSAEVWAPAKGVNVSDYLEIPTGFVFDVAFSGGIPNDRLPLQFMLDAKNNLVVTSADASAPNPNLSDEWKKILKGKVDIKSGKVVISLTLSDKRKVTIEGVIVKPQGDEVDTFRFAPGFVLIPPLDKKLGTIIAEALEFQGPYVEDPNLAGAAAVAGKYSAVIKKEEDDGNIGDVKDKEIIQFTISADLKTLTFDGKKLPFYADSRPGSISYLIRKGFNTTTVQIFLGDGGYGQPYGFFLSYIKPLSGGIASYSSDQITKLP